MLIPNNKMSKKIAIKILLFIVIVAAVLMLVLKLTNKPNIKPSPSVNKPVQVSEKDKPQIVSTKPDPLEGSMISGSETIEITFNRPLENVGEFKVRIDPEAEFKLELSPDRKTGKIIPIKPYELGQGYTIFIGTETKFDGVGRWGEEKIYHFRTIKYRGI